MKIWIRRAVSVLLVIALLLGFQRLVVPKYVSEFAEGGFTAEYYRETMGHQVLMVGDCELYDNFSPAALWQKYGITSYIRGNAQQLTWQTYYMLKEALKRETPDVVVVNVLELVHNEPVREEYNRLALDEMRWSKEKLEAIQASRMSDEHLLDYIFPLLRYHSRITQLTKDDLTYYTGTGNVQRTTAGYHMRVDVDPYEPEEEPDGEDTSGEEGLSGEEDDSEEDASGEENAWEDVSEEEDVWEDVPEDGDVWEDIPEEEDVWEDIPEKDVWEDVPEEEDGSEAEDISEEESGAEEEESLEDEDISEEDVWEDIPEADEGEDVSDEVDPGDEGGDAWSDEPEDFTFGSRAMAYMDRITQLCKEKNIRLLLVKAPSLTPVWYDEWEAQVLDYAKKHDLDYINFLELAEEIGIDYSQDTYDGGLHMNVTGAEKCADYLGKFLSEKYSLTDLRGDADTAAEWERKTAFYEELKAAQYEELEKYGELVSFY